MTKVFFPIKIARCKSAMINCAAIVSHNPEDIQSEKAIQTSSTIYNTQSPLMLHFSRASEIKRLPQQPPFHIVPVPRF
jgi:hypothetical protein